MEKVMKVVLFFLFFLCCNSITLSSRFAISSLEGRETDHLALLAFKDQITQDPSGALSSWNDTTHYCHWEGVTCSRKHPERVAALDLFSLGLVGSISPSIGNLTFLRRIFLMNNGLHGEIPSEIARLNRLQHLNLSENSFQGGIPINLTLCSDLRIVDFSSNQLTGIIPFELGSLLKLNVLALDHNGITGLIPSSLGNLSSLTVLSLSLNRLQGSIPEELGRLVSLSMFKLSNNILSGTIPSTLYNLSSLYYFDMGTNRLRGNLPPDIGITLPNLQFLLLGDNQFEGPIPASLSNASRLVQINIPFNRFRGIVPSDLGRLRGLSKLNLGRNQLEANNVKGWEFLTSLSNCSRLQILGLMDNKLRGVLPPNSVANLSTQLQVLILGSNQISGVIPSGIGNLVNLNTLGLFQNLFTGSIPESIGKLQRLQQLYLGRNWLEGHIPSSLGNLTQMIVLFLANNHLEGPIPSSLSRLQHLQLLNLSNNSLNGTIPKELGSLSFLSNYLDLSDNSLVGPLPSELGSLKNLKSLSVSRNKLYGEIPDAIGNCQNLEVMSMDNNFFQGTIPSLRSMNNLQELNLSHNNMSGTIPEFLEKLTVLDLSFNRLEGEVPITGVFQDAAAVSLFGNDGLCGGISQLQLSACPVKTSKKKGWSLVLKIVIALAGTGFCLILFFFCFAFHSRWESRKKTSPLPSLMDQYNTISYIELFEATNGFSSTNLIGMGRYSSVYKGSMHHANKTVAVKVFNLQQRGVFKSFIAECDMLRSVRHRNLIKALSSCSSVDYGGNDFRAIVFEFMPNWSLEEWLHPRVQGDHQMKKLSLIQRLNIATDVADALDYLHNNCQPPLVHCDVKPSNILLDNLMTAHLGDFGLARSLSKATNNSSEDSSSSYGIVGTIGYVAPEYGADVRVSTSRDVYSFGILLLEMFTVKRPTDDMFKDGLSLYTFVKMAFPDQVMEIVDQLFLLQEEDEGVPNINQNGSNVSRIRQCLVSVIRIGLMCSKHTPKQRMNMRDVAAQMHAIKDAYLGLGLMDTKGLLRGEGPSYVSYY